MIIPKYINDSKHLSWFIGANIKDKKIRKKNTFDPINHTCFYI